MEDIASVDVPEIEVTPEMIDAGLDVIAGFSTREDSYDDVVRDVFVAMAMASRRG